jgi:hypothetical protein
MFRRHLGHGLVNLLGKGGPYFFGLSAVILLSLPPAPSRIIFQPLFSV